MVYGPGLSLPYASTGQVTVVDVAGDSLADGVRVCVVDLALQRVQWGDAVVAQYLYLFVFVKWHLSPHTTGTHLGGDMVGEG